MWAATLDFPACQKVELHVDRAYISAMESSVEFFDHTADMGVRVRAPSLAELVPVATKGLYSVIGQIVCGDPLEDVLIHLQGENPEIVLRDYLARVLLLFETKQTQLLNFKRVEFDHRALLVHAESALVDHAHSVYYREVKAVTYHELAIRETPDGFEATFIVDI